MKSWGIEIKLQLHRVCQVLYNYKYSINLLLISIQIEIAWSQVGQFHIKMCLTLIKSTPVFKHRSKCNYFYPTLFWECFLPNFVLKILSTQLWCGNFIDPTLFWEFNLPNSCCSYLTWNIYICELTKVNTTDILSAFFSLKSF